MGNSSSSSGRPHTDDSVDYGQLVPQGVYSGVRDWNQNIAAQLIIQRKLAPFYRPLEDYDPAWDDDRILAARKELPETEGGEQQPPPPPPPTASTLKASSKRPSIAKEPSKPEAMVYRGAVECPICFLYYPPNINHSRCCDQAICTECFVQIKRSEPTTTHLVSEPAACPYCVQDNFGVVYSPPPWRAGIASEGTNSPWSDSPKGSQQSIDTSAPYPTHKRRQKSFGADSPEVVLTDQIRPDWEAKLAAVRAAVTRRANRRIIMRQVGDRLIPVGVTSGRVHALTPEEAAQAEASVEGSGSRRSRRRQQPPPNGNFEQFMGLGGPELEELMMMEAMRLSLIDHEEQQRKEAEEKKKKAAAEASATEASASASTSADPGPSTSEGRSSIPAPIALHSSSPPSASPTAPLSPTDSLAVHRKSSSMSRSRSPSPSPFQALKDTASSWRRRTSSPPPFSTLTAALSNTVSTASAVISGTNEPNPGPVPTALPHTPRSTGDGDNAPIPTITVEPSATTSAPSEEAGPSSARPSSVQRESFASSVFSTSSSVGPDAYDNLPSSPDSFVAHEPLLSGSTPATPKNDTEHAADYFGGAAATTRE